ncbi:MAG TPA: hypothetical protein EYG92_10015 [Lutibacter sp.]|nr:hypothetical protein [Lutibacter sp.]
MKIPKQYNSLEYIHDIEWCDIFAVWRSYEAYQENWQGHWKERGFKSWDEWRRDYVAPLKPENRKWSIYRVKEPNIDFPKIYGVPSKGWKKNVYGSKMTISLAEVVEKISADEQKNEKVEAIKNNFPYQTMLTGIINKDRIILIEGMHRGVALAMMSEDEIKGDVVIVLAEYEDDVGVVLGKG